MLSRSGIGFSQNQYGGFDPTLEKSFHNKYIVDDKDYDFSNGFESQSVFAPNGHHVLNIKALCVSLFLPWILFAVLLHLMLFRWHYTDPEEVYLALLVGLLVSLCTAAYARWKEKSSLPEPMWYKYHGIAFFWAVFWAFVIGNYGFWKYSEKYYDYETLNVYTDVNPAKEKGQMLMDSGRVYFTHETRVGTEFSMGFKNRDVYCVAPIIKGEERRETYDFWTVGINCCDHPPGKFQCGQANNPLARSAIRQLGDDDREMYRLAVQQAEAAYGLKATHPVFFYWVADPVHEIDMYYVWTWRIFIYGIAGYFCINLFFVVAASFAFSKIGRVG